MLKVEGEWMSAANPEAYFLYSQIMGIKQALGTQKAIIEILRERGNGFNDIWKIENFLDESVEIMRKVVDECEKEKA